MSRHLEEPTNPMLHMRTDGRHEVADNEDANDTYGCLVDDWCILANNHAGPCNDDREVWARVYG